MMKKLVFTAAVVAVVCASANLQAQVRFKPLGESAATKYQPRVLELFYVSLYDHFQGPLESDLGDELTSDAVQQAAVRDAELGDAELGDAELGDAELGDVNELYLYFLVMGCRPEEAIEMVEYVLIAMPD